jgi:PAS domain S-box-containing protein
MYFRILLVTLLFLTIGLPGQVCAQQQINIGVLSFQPTALTETNWSALGQSLEAHLADTTVFIIPMSDTELEDAIQNHQIDFVLSPPTQYIYFCSLYGLTAPLITVIRGDTRKALHAFGGAIFVRSDNPDIETLADLKGYKVAIPFDRAFGAFQMQQYELYLQGLPLIQPHQFVLTGLPHDNVVNAVVAGKAEVGFARAGTLERMAVAGKIDINQFKVINRQPFADFPAQVSTHLYPEWPLAALPHVSSERQSAVVAALLSMHSSAAEGLLFNILGFQMPANYAPVEVLMRTLRIAPFDSVPELRLSDVWIKYRGVMSLFIVAVAIILFLSFYLYLSRRRIKDSEAMFRTYFQTNGVVQLVLDPETGRIQDVNEQAIRYYGYTRQQFLEKTAFDINTLPADLCRAKIAECLSQKHNFFTFQHRLASGEIRDIESYVSLIQMAKKPVIIGTIIDITERLTAERQRSALEDQLRQKHKMEAVGYMAGGMAHNFNNNLSIILGNVELAQMQQPTGSEVITFLENAKIGIRRSRDLVQKIVTYSRQGIQQMAPTQLTSITDETISLLKSTMPSTINLQNVYSSECNATLINADASQIQEVLINLCNNAIQAMQEKGELKIQLETVELTQQEIPAQYDCLPGRYAKLSIKDSGCGMTAEIVDKIFDPFFTTKEEYAGVGMGLATVQGIVIQHGGIIKVDSTPGQGSVFNLYFPIIEQTHIVEPAAEDKTTPRGTERILFVDDDEMLTHLGEQLLTKMGYQVTAMTDSAEALKMFAANAEHFNLVITDQTMPNLCGTDLIVELKKISPDIPTILYTGYSSKVDEAEAKKMGINAFMMKPLDPVQLAQTVRRVLDGIETE